MSDKENIEVEDEEEVLDEDIELSNFDEIQDSIIGLKDSLEDYYEDLEKDEKEDVIAMIEEQIGTIIYPKKDKDKVETAEETDEHSKYDEMFEEKDEEVIDEDLK